MDNDYLWDPSAPPDPEVERLEQMLGRLRSTTPAPSIADLVRRMPGHDVLRWRTARFLGPALAAAAAVVLMIAASWQSMRTLHLAPGWDVASLEGQPRIGSAIVADIGRLAVGQTLTTDASSRARLDISTLGAVTVETNSRVRLVATRADHFRLALERGTLHAVIVAPPRQFVVDTPSSRATDLGCAYMLHVDEDGTGLLSVTAGWVSFESKGRESFVPAGASARTDPDHGPGTPRYDVTDQRFRDELDFVDEGPRMEGYASALAYVLEHASVHDAMTLWHLIPRVAPSDRGAVVDALAARAPMPTSVSRDAVMRLDKAALDQWWDSLGLQDASWWRLWKSELGK
ncbi:MAG: FecR domain-containing protein [Acidobacteria bacterium]|nr:FecR domain-containing protein [Acidobacteriota bacterium]